MLINKLINSIYASIKRNINIRNIKTLFKINCQEIQKKVIPIEVLEITSKFMRRILQIDKPHFQLSETEVDGRWSEIDTVRFPEIPSLKFVQFEKILSIRVLL